MAVASSSAAHIGIALRAIWPPTGLTIPSGNVGGGRTGQTISMTITAARTSPT